MREDKIILQDGKLELILKKKENGIPLKEEEIKTAMRLIERAIPTGGGGCWVCEMSKNHTPAIFDTGLCKKHARELLLEKDS